VALVSIGMLVSGMASTFLVMILSSNSRPGWTELAAIAGLTVLGIVLMLLLSARAHAIRLGPIVANLPRTSERISTKELAEAQAKQLSPRANKAIAFLCLGVALAMVVSLVTLERPFDFSDPIRAVLVGRHCSAVIQRGSVPPARQQSDKDTGGHIEHA
jgi:Na+/melibiose symporter-like transporter